MAFRKLDNMEAKPFFFLRAEAGRATLEINGPV